MERMNMTLDNIVSKKKLSEATFSWVTIEIQEILVEQIEKCFLTFLLGMK